MYKLTAIPRAVCVHAAAAAALNRSCLSSPPHRRRYSTAPLVLIRALIFLLNSRAATFKTAIRLQWKWVENVGQENIRAEFFFQDGKRAPTSFQARIYVFSSLCGSARLLLISLKPALTHRTAKRYTLDRR